MELNNLVTTMSHMPVPTLLDDFAWLRDTVMRVDQAHMMPETVQSLTVTDKEVGGGGWWVDAA